MEQSDKPLVDPERNKELLKEIEILKKRLETIEKFIGMSPAIMKEIARNNIYK